jgi:atlastin
MGGQDEPLFGFSSRSGIKRDTTGIIFWNDVFLYNNEKTGEKLAIIVMDTQGLFDNDTTPLDNSRIFALSSLISSIQIFNLTGVIQEDQLQYLQFATEYAKFATEDSVSGKAFQKLVFLIRDWVSF